MSDEGTFCYAITSGAYSDYSVGCVFERLDDAIAYLRLTNPDCTIKPPDPSSQWPEWGVIKPGRTDPDWYDERIERFQFWPAGVVPHVDA